MINLNALIKLDLNKVAKTCINLQNTFYWNFLTFLMNISATIIQIKNSHEILILSTTPGGIGMNTIWAKSASVLGHGLLHMWTELLYWTNPYNVTQTHSIFF